MRFLPVLPIAAFFLALLPLAGNYAIHHPDEQYYTAAAIEMVRGGDYLTPRDEQGRPRLQKPILTYWLVAASYALFGISALSSRLPFLLAGAALLAVVYAMTRDLIPDRAAACFALLALVAEPQLVLASLRSMTDVVLALALTVSAWGFLAAIASQRRARKYLVMAYVGAALAFLSKGFLAFGFVAFALGFAFAERRRAGLAALVDAPAMLGAAALAGAWLAVAWLAPGGEGLRIFLNDQVAHRFATGLAMPLLVVPGFVALYFVGFLPWSAPAARLVAGAGSGGAVDAKRRGLRRFVILWSLLLAVVFGCAREPEEHYVLPAVPLLAVLLGDVLAGARTELRERYLRQTLAATLGCVLLLGIATLWAQLQLDASARAELSLLALLAAAIGLGAAGLHGGAIGAPTAQALVLLLVFPMLGLAMAPVALPDQGEQLANRLAALGVDHRPVLFVGGSGTAGKVRVASGGTLDVRRADALDGNADYAAIVVPREQAARLAERGYELHPGSSGYRSLDVVELLYAVGRGDLRRFLDRHRSELVIGLRHRS